MIQVKTHLYPAHNLSFYSFRVKGAGAMQCGVQRSSHYSVFSANSFCGVPEMFSDVLLVTSARWNTICKISKRTQKIDLHFVINLNGNYLKYEKLQLSHLNPFKYY